MCNVASRRSVARTFDASALRRRRPDLILFHYATGSAVAGQLRASRDGEMRTGIALGSNLGDRLANLTAGRETVLRLEEVSAPVLHSRVYETEPVGTGPEAGPFLNAVMEVEFTGDPAAQVLSPT